MTTEAIYNRKIAKIRDQLTSVRHIILLDQGVSRGDATGTLNYRHLMAGVDDDAPIEPTAASDPGAAALHQRHDRHAEGRASTCTGPSHALRHRPVRPRPPPRRHLLVHRRSRLGDRDVLRHHRAAPARRDHDRRRGASSTPSAGTGSCRTQRVTRLVHRADGDADADARRRRARARSTTCPRCASSPASASRSTPRRWCGAQARLGCRSTTTGGRPRPAAS